MTSSLPTVLCVTLCWLSCGLLSSAVAEEILLWPAGHPANGEPDAQPSETRPGWIQVTRNPSILPVLPSEQDRTGAAVVVCAGGGYGGLAFEKEAMEICRWLKDRGVCAYALKYRCGGPPNEHPAPLDDALRAMRLVRSQAEDLGIDREKVGVMGFSAGGHLASSVSTLSDDGDAAAVDRVDRLSSRPNFSLLIYPVISMEQGVTHSGSRKNLLGGAPSDELVRKLSTDLQVSEQTPPTFMVHTTDDGAVPVENAMRYYRALVAAKVSAELHVFEEGGHGYGMRPTGKTVDQWPALAESWLRRHQLIR